MGKNPSPVLLIKHKRQDCIGCALCAEVAPNYWHIDAEGLAQLHQVLREESPFQIAQAFEEDRASLKEAALHCPVSIIRLEG